MCLLARILGGKREKFTWLEREIKILHCHNFHTYLVFLDQSHQQSFSRFSFISSVITSIVSYWLLTISFQNLILTNNHQHCLNFHIKSQNFPCRKSGFPITKISYPSLQDLGWKKGNERKWENFIFFNLVGMKIGRYCLVVIPSITLFLIPKLISQFNFQKTIQFSQLNTKLSLPSKPRHCNDRDLYMTQLQRLNSISNWTRSAVAKNNHYICINSSDLNMI